MSFEIFQKGAAINSEFEIIPTKVKLLSLGATTDVNGYINYEGKTYVTNMVKLKDLPNKLRSLFVEENTTLQKYDEEVKDIQTGPKTKNKLEDLNTILFEQLQNIVDPEKDVDVQQELKKATTVCNVADKIIKIADLALSAEKFHAQGLIGKERNIYECR